MIKETVSYTDYDNQKKTATLWFHLKQSKVSGDMSLVARMEKISKIVGGDQRELTMDEVQEILDLVKTFMKLAYGQRSEDGLRFRQTEEIWQDFEDSAVYDEFLFSLFREPAKAFAFLLALVPEDTRKETEAQVRAQHPELFDEDGNIITGETPKDSGIGFIPETSSDQPPWVREKRYATKEELDSMTAEQLREAIALGLVG